MEGGKNMKVLNKKILPPDAVRTIEGLRDTGYEFNTAMADIIDNSIAANASLVEVSIEMDYSGELIIQIADNGTGMNEEGLEAAMVYGSPQRNVLKSLGKFGLGLKTASTAFCRKLSVVTRDSGNSTVYKACWDLDYVAKVQDWELLLVSPSIDELNKLEEVTDNGSGTIVIWENIDRLLKDYQDRTGVHARRALDRTILSLREHVALVYNRFLNMEYTDAPNVTIKINNEKVEAWDPFCKDEPMTELVATQCPEVNFQDGKNTSFTVNAYVLPRAPEFSSEEAKKRAKLSNNMQGFYVYRENRLINYGNWMGMYTNEPHGTLLRVEFSFDYRLDDAFHVDIKKSRISLNGDLYDWFKNEFLPGPRRAADERARTGKRENIKKVSKDAHDVSNKGISYREKELKMSNAEIKNLEKNDVEITNKKGKVKIKLAIMEPSKDGELYVAPVESIEDGLLWEPALIDKHNAVRVNTNHPYYHKVYIPNLSSGVTVQGLDSLLWALGEAELGTISEDTRYHLKELRYEVSRILRRLVEDLPDPGLEDND